MHLMSSTKQAISAMELGRRPGLGHATAWYLHKRLRHAMTERNERSRIGGGGGPPGPDKGQPAAASPPRRSRSYRRPARLQFLRQGRPKRERTSPFFTLNTLIANLSTALKATYKHFSPKHLPDYLGAFCWTTNHRRSMPGMVDALCRAVASSSRLTRNRVYSA